MCADTNPVRERLPPFYATVNYNMTDTVHTYTQMRSVLTQNHTLSPTSSQYQKGRRVPKLVSTVTIIAKCIMSVNAALKACEFSVLNPSSKHCVSFFIVYK